MHSLEPFYGWLELYDVEEDDKSPFYGVEHSQFEYKHKVYNYYIHPQWASIGSETLYAKLLFADYENGYAIMELIGEWNDCLLNDIMYLKRKIADKMFDHGIFKYVLCMDKVLNFHGLDSAYYEEWLEDLIEEDGWVACIETQVHVLKEMQKHSLGHYMHIGEELDTINWRKLKPKMLFQKLETIINKQRQTLS